MKMNESYSAWKEKRGREIEIRINLKSNLYKPNQFACY